MVAARRGGRSTNLGRGRGRIRPVGAGLVPGDREQASGLRIRMPDPRDRVYHRQSYLEFAPPDVVAHGLREVHNRPLASWGRYWGGEWDPGYRMHPRDAWNTRPPRFSLTRPRRTRRSGSTLMASRMSTTRSMYSPAARSRARTGRYSTPVRSRSGGCGRHDVRTMCVTTPKFRPTHYRYSGAFRFSFDPGVQSTRCPISAWTPTTGSSVGGPV